MDKFSALKYYYGYDTFKEGQAEVIDQLLDGRDALCIMPTGAGKSVCYQIPALLQSGTTIVVSPLISLMKDCLLYTSSLTGGRLMDKHFKKAGAL